MKNNATEVQGIMSDKIEKKTGKAATPYADEDACGEDEEEASNHEIEVDEDKKPAAREPPGQLIERPHSNDVLLGRGRPLQRHPGNVRFHQTVNRYREMYVNAKKHEKVNVTRCVVNEVSMPSSAAPGARFLRRAESGRYWEEVSDKIVFEKTSHALRGRPTTGHELDESDTNDRTSDRNRNYDVDRLPIQMGSYTITSALGSVESKESTSRSDSSSDEQPARTSIYPTEAQDLLLGYSPTVVGTLTTSTGAGLVNDGLSQRAALIRHLQLQNHGPQLQGSEMTREQDGATSSIVAPPLDDDTTQLELQLLVQLLHEAQRRRYQEEDLLQHLMSFQSIVDTQHPPLRRLLDPEPMNPIAVARDRSPGVIPPRNLMTGPNIDWFQPFRIRQEPAAVTLPHPNSSISQQNIERGRFVAPDELIRRHLQSVSTTQNYNNVWAQLQHRNPLESVGQYLQNNNLSSSSVVESTVSTASNAAFATAAAASRTMTNTLQGCTVPGVTNITTLTEALRQNQNEESRRIYVATLTEALRHHQNEEDRRVLMEAIMRNMRPNG
jgi:Arc/MetJ-type ribon-helix-helix transcriptional regulator